MWELYIIYYILKVIIINAFLKLYYSICLKTQSHDAIINVWYN